MPPPPPRPSSASGAAPAARASSQASPGAKGDPLLPRVSMNLSMLTNCHALLLLVKGAQKKALIQEVRAEAVAAPQRYPVGMLLAQSKKTVQLCYLD